MLLSTAEINAWIGSFWWPLIRIAAMLSIAPLFGSRILPRRVRLGFALGLTWIVVPLIPSVPVLEPISPTGLMISGQQLLIGISMGFILRLVFSALEIGGQLIAVQMGLGFDTLVDPHNGGQMPVLSHFYGLIGSLIFLALNGHLVLIEVLVESFKTLPIAAKALPAESFWVLAAWASQMFAGAVLIALPAVASLTVVNLAFGIMTRAAPQFNIFGVGFPISLLLGLLIVLYSLPSLLPRLQGLLDQAFQTLWRLLEGAA